MDQRPPVAPVQPNDFEMDQRDVENVDDHDQQGFVLNEYVVEHIISYLKLPDLKSCRLVSGLWSDAARKHMQNKGSIRDGLIWTLCSSIPEAAGAGDNSLDIVGNFGFESIGIDLHLFSNNTSARLALFDFLVQFGSQIKSATFTTCNQTIDFLFYFVGLLPNVKSLKIVLTHFPELQVPKIYALYNREIQSIEKVCIHVKVSNMGINSISLFEKYKEFFLRILRQTPNLESLELLYSPPYESARCNDTFNMMVRILEKCMRLHDIPCSYKLRDLTFKQDEEEWSSFDLVKFHCLSIKIKIRKLYLPNYIPFSDAVDAFQCGNCLLSIVKYHGQLLIELGITLPTYFVNTESEQYDIVHEFPTMRLLKKLVVEIFFKFANDISVLRFSPVQYDLQLPMLEELTIIIHCSECGVGQTCARTTNFLDFFFKYNDQLCKSLQRLTIKLPYKWDTSSENPMDYHTNLIRVLSNMFPNVNNHHEINRYRTNKLKV